MSSETHKVAFIFDWNKRYDEFSIYRITKELVSDKERYIPRYIKYLGGEVQEMIDPDGEQLKALKSGRYHWRGTITFSRDYWGDFEEEWAPDSITRIR